MPGAAPPSWGAPCSGGTWTSGAFCGTGTDQEFDPRYYEEAPQNPPEVQAPPEQTPPDQGQQGVVDPGAQ